MDRDEAIARIRAGLLARTGRPWSVTGGRGTGWGWITVTAPPARRVCSLDGPCGPDCQHWRGYMAPADRALLGMALGATEPEHPQGASIAASSAYRTEYVDRAEGRSPSVVGTPYWD